MNLMQCLAAGVLLLLGGCSESYWTSNVRDVRAFPPGTETITNADVRLVHHVRAYEWIMADPEHTGTNHPVEQLRDMYCAEPSPDVARVVQAALSAQGNVAATVTPPGAGSGTAVEAQLTAALAASRAEGIAQLTRRISTIQLLRDGLYRACEAYVNGALDRTSYTAILANFDNLMVTMLLSEMAVGNVGSAALLTGSTSAGTPAGDVQAATTRATTAAANLKAERDKQQTDTQALVGMPKPADGDIEAAQKFAAQKTLVDQDNAAVASARQEASAAQLALKAATANASASSGGEIATTSPQAQTAETLYKMLQDYFLVPRGNAALLTCIQAANDPARTTPRFCQELLDGLPGALLHAGDQRFRLMVTERSVEYLSACADALKAAKAAGVSAAQMPRCVLPAER